MLVRDSDTAHIYITSYIEEAYAKFEQRFKPLRVVGFIEEKFKLEHAKAVVAEAYISESQNKYIIFGSKEFTSEAQNSLLKVLEEPPRNIVFIIITPTKANLLPTIRSRLPIIQGEVTHEETAIDISLSKVDYGEVFKFLKTNARVSKNDAKVLVEGIYKRATEVDKLILTTSQLDNFAKAYRLLELNSRPQSVLALLLMGFVHGD